MWIKQAGCMDCKEKRPRDYRRGAGLQWRYCRPANRQAAAPTDRQVLTCGCRAFLGAVGAVSISGADAI